jgi:multiple sugar transport system substrate-binding protein
MKRVTTLTKLLVAALLAILPFTVACSERVEKTPDGRTIINFWHTYNDQEEQVLKEIILEWEKANPEWTVKSVRLPFDGHKPKIRTALTVGRGPDMARVDWSFVCELARKNALVDLEQYGFLKIKEDYLAAPLGTNFIDGKYYGLPDQTTGVAMFYNRRLFRDAGLDPDAPPTTWEDFVVTAKKLTQGEIFGFAMENTLWWTLPFFNTYGARLISEDGRKCLLDSPAAISAMEFKKSLYEVHKIEPGAWRAGSITPEQGFLNEKYAMIFMGPWNLPKFAGSKIDFGVSLIPAGPAGTSTNVGGTNLVIMNTSKNPGKAYEFMIFFTSPAVQAKWCSVLNQMPVNVRAYDLVKFEDKHLNIFMEQMKHAVSNPIVTNYEVLEDLINPEMEAILTGQKTAEAALKTAARKIEKRVLARR